MEKQPPPPFSLGDFIQATGGILLSNHDKMAVNSLKKIDLNFQFKGIGTDTRKDLQNRVFIALNGESYDGHNFLDKAVEAGAQALVIHRLPQDWSSRFSNSIVIQVKDTLKALQDFARFQRIKSSTKVIGITGSNGKTTSKEFTAQLLSPYFKTHYSVGSFNNHWGVPFTLLDTPMDTEIVIVEMGMNHPGEITELVKISEPNTVVCTMVGRAHIEFFGTVEKIAEAKEEIYNTASHRALRIYNLDDPQTHKMWKRFLETIEAQYPGSPHLTFSTKTPATDVHFKIEKFDFDGLSIIGHIHGEEGSCQIPIFGVQNLTNLMVATCCALAVGLSPEKIWATLPRCKTNWGRNQLVKLKSGARILFDGYNANPDSMTALIKNFEPLKTAGKKIAILGQMREQGTASYQAHFDLGHLTGEAGFDSIFFVGEDSAAFKAGIESTKFKGNLMISGAYEESLARQFASMINNKDIALIKGSRGMKMERFLEFCEPLNFNFNKESSVL